ncbi:hypothetical protein ACIQVA_36795 [Streptomyces microflavus]|uniref:hypothetical protein n=1 Tax=Streptomyces microflavus TaxID=1919 RepID=UPI003820E04F
MSSASEATVQSSRAARLLYGVALHGAARRAAGLELTDLETRLVKTLGGVLSEGEALGFGQVYAQEEAGRSRLFPDCLASRPVDAGYSAEDLARDLPALAAEVSAQANVRVIDLDAADGGQVRGARTDEEFVRASAAYGYGAVVVTASGQSVAAGALAIEVRMDLTKFWCYSESNEWSGSDEIFWAACCAADEGSERTIATRVYGDVDKGETHHLDANSTVFQGAVNKALVVHIECWEKDQGRQETVRRMLDEMTTELRTTAEKLALLPLGDWQSSEHYTALAGMLADLAYAIVQASGDDWVAGHVFAYDRSALQRLAGTEFKAGAFQGEIEKADGAHDLYARIDATSPYFNDVSLVTYGGTGWTAPAQPWPHSKTPAAPALALHEGLLYCAVRGMGNHVYVSRRESDGRWSAFGQVPGAVTEHGPALASYMGKLYVAYTGADAKGYYATSARGDQWSDPKIVSNGHPCSTGAALAVSDGRLWYASTDVNTNFMISSLAVGAWWPLTHFEAFRTRSTPALTQFQGTLHLAYRGLDNRVFTTRRGGLDEYPWTDPLVHLGSSTTSPALGVRGDTLYCAIRDQNDRLHIAGNPGTGWGTLQPLPTNVITKSEPALATTGDNLFVVYRDNDF